VSVTAQVFISHSSKDAQLAETLCGALENRGIRCWMSPRDIDPGENYAASIVRAIRAGKVMVLIFTTNANASNEITKELALASQYGLVVIPARVEEVIPSDALAYQLATSQWVDMFRDWETAIERVARQIRAIAAIEATAGSAAGAPTPTRPQPIPPVAAAPASPVAETRPVPPMPAPPLRPEATAPAVGAQRGRPGRGVVLWSATTGEFVRELHFPAGQVADFAFSPDGRRIVAGGYKGGLCVVDTTTGQSIRTFGQDKGHIANVLFSGDSRWIVAISWTFNRPGAISVWDAQTGALVRELDAKIRADCAAISPDGRFLAAGLGLSTIRTWDLATGQPLQTIQTHAGGVLGLAFSPDGARIAAGNRNGMITICDIASAAVVTTLWHLGTVNTVAFSPDGELIAAGGYRGSVPVWSARTNQRLFTLQEHGANVRAVAFSPDGKVLASGSDDQTSKVWDPRTGALLRTIATGSVAKNLPVTRMGFSPDGASVAMLGGLGQVTDVPGYDRAFGLLAGAVAWVVLQALGSSYFSGLSLSEVFETWQWTFWIMPGVLVVSGIGMLFRTQHERELKMKLEGPRRS
jgi:hypothetical protein